MILLLAMALAIDQATISPQTFTALQTNTFTFKSSEWQKLKKRFFWNYYFSKVGLYQNYSNSSSLPYHFTLHELTPALGTGITIALIDTAIKKHRDLVSPLAALSCCMNPEQDELSMLHGTHTCGIIQHMAPHASIISIKAFDQKNTSSLAMITEGLNFAWHCNADIIHLGLKIADFIDFNIPLYKDFCTTLSKFDYVVAAAGNDGDPKHSNYSGRHLAYPARSENVYFSVGSFDYKDNQLVHPAFSQYEPGIGPRFILPGVDILSCSSFYKDSYTFLQGTSTSAALLTGFLALLLAEFQNYFSYQEIIQVIEKLTSLPHHQDWQEKALLGIPDMRAILFCLHVLAFFRQKTKSRGPILNLIAPLNQLFQLTFPPLCLPFTLSQAIKLAAQPLITILTPQDLQQGIATKKRKKILYRWRQRIKALLKKGAQIRGSKPVID
jgi:Subtilase family